MEDLAGPQLGNLIVSIGYAIEGLGVIVIVMGIIWASAAALKSYTSGKRDDIYHSYRRHLGQSMMLGLEFLVAGDIIRTVIVAHTISDILGLGLIVLIRTVLVFTIHLEVEGRWPWQAEQQ